MLRRFVRLPDGWIFLAGYCLIGLGYILFGTLASVGEATFLAMILAYFVVAFVLTVIKTISLRSMSTTRLNFLVFEFITIVGFVLLLLTCEA
ncbi:MAG: hypothetical protein LKH74_01745 [Levilactobacillus sp.]|jgi:uncharacterized membrane protein HdeD (DUF308 family)|uniref:hypothetical protein n=1 Tax=Levilactobacillus sp. TaxID=2767919 RepID=UPI002582F070|nr:hypothetical protein [Levilactobacillus sp.]MCH4123229.1 hypothetical protein [Levilactobacillus sp.]MCI1552633.1 hypothetical protein [Levilactobacillus sp.]